MATATNSILELRKRWAQSPDPASAILALTEECLSRANSNASHNTYLWRDEDWTLREAQNAVSAPDSQPLRGIPVSVKDCFDLAGSPTSRGTHFYRDLNGVATEDSWLVARLRAAGAIITGKTHLHPLAYGITGENPDFGDCLQPGDPTALTGGSSSGAAVSVMEGSALAAIGTDTGGSIRVPAALCGLAGYRASLEFADWTGAAHLAPSFDTMGWLFRDLEDTPALASLFGVWVYKNMRLPTGFAIVDDAFLHDCEPAVIDSYRRSQAELQSLGLTCETISVDWWSDSIEIFAAIQASEAALIHQGHFGQIDPAIRQRLEWGASLGDADLSGLRNRRAEFQHRMGLLLTNHQLLLLPAAPVTRLEAGADHSETRMRLLRYTTPISLAGMPAITLPYFANNRPAGGMQLVAAHEDDARLLALAAQIGAHRKSAGGNRS